MTTPPLSDAVGIGDVPVVSVASHDTASAVAAVPAVDERFAYISSDTWSLVGLELDEPVLSEAARLADFTNEGGADGTVRFLKNMMGLWVTPDTGPANDMPERSEWTYRTSTPCALVRRTHDVRRHEPRSGLSWDAAGDRPSTTPGAQR